MSSRSREDGFRMPGAGFRRLTRPLSRRAELAVLALPACALALVAALGPRRDAPAPDTPNPEPGARALRVCADPNNLPFSNERREGLENRLAKLVGEELGMRVEYTWFAQRRGFIRETLGAGTCDVIPGIVASSERVLATRPYYRSTYVFVTRTDAPAAGRVASLDDPALRTLRIGLHMVGDDYTNTPPAHALARRGIVDNVRGYLLYGDYAQPDPPLTLVDAVVRGEVDVAIAWGPFAGWARAKGAPLALRPVAPSVDLPFLPFVFDIAMGVRRSDVALRDSLDAALGRRRADVAALLAEYGMPTVGAGGTFAVAAGGR